eukprot:Gb_36105 [translate_table: standard]
MTLAKNMGEYEMEQFDRVMRVNVKGVMLGIKHAAHVMIPRKKGYILYTSSVGGLLGGFSPYSYTASKHAIIGLTKNGATELGKYSIRVNAVSPFGLPTTLSLSINGHSSSSSISQEDMANMENFCSNIANLKGPILKARDVAEAGLYLASDEADLETVGLVLWHLEMTGLILWHCDVSKEEDVSVAVIVAMKLHGCLDIMYNNVGINDMTLDKNVGEYDMEQFDRVMRVNVKGVMLGIKHAVCVMIPRKKGCILYTSSVGGMLGGFSPSS